MLLLALLTLLGADPAVETLYVQATSLNLREKPDPGGALVKVVPIGTACQPLQPPADGWSKLHCEEDDR